VSKAPASVVSANTVDGLRAVCPGCAAGMRFDAEHQALCCDHCGLIQEIAPGEQTNVVEHDLERGAAGQDRGLGAPALKSTHCEGCGAVVSYAGLETAATCEFCGSDQVLAQTENRNLIRPGSLLPFTVTDQAAQAAFSGWLGGLWFRPRALKKLASVSQMRGIYVPYWTFDAHVSSDWTAQAGHHYYDTEHHTDHDADGNPQTRTRRVRRTRWEHTSGSRRDSYDDVSVCASRGLPAKLVGKLEAFDTDALVPYDASYLAGWRAEEYGVGLNDAWEQALATMQSVQQSRCAADVPGDTHRFLHVTNTFSHETFKHALFPIWFSAYRYKGEVYQFLVHGRTGKVTGHAPVSRAKIALMAAAIAGLVATIWFIGTR